MTMRWLRLLFHRDEVEREFDRELQYHLDRRTEELIAAGRSPSKARRQARIEFGGVTQVKEDMRTTWIARWLEDLIRDLGYACRTLRRTPGFTAVTMISLALGIGVNAAVFSALYHVALRPLPYSDSDRIVTLRASNAEYAELMGKQTGTRTDRWLRMNVSVPDFLDWQRETRSFETMAMFRGAGFTLGGIERPRPLRGASVSVDFFNVMGKQPVMGRGFLREEDTAGGEQVAVLSHGVFNDDFGGNPNILNSKIELNDTGYTVVGIMPPGFDYPNKSRLWTPLQAGSGPRDSLRSSRGTSAIARLQDGVNIEEAGREMDVVTARLEAQYPDSNDGWRVAVTGLHEHLVGASGTPLLVLYGAVGLVLLIACANIANLLLGRGAFRAREMSVRSVLGAGSWRLARQSLTESLVISSAGAVLGLALALRVIRTVRALLPEGVFRGAEIGVDWPVLGYTVTTAVLTGLVFGLFPAWQACSAKAPWFLRAGHVSAPGLGHFRLRGLLVASQLALALVLMVGAGLMLNTFWRLNQIDRGFQADNVLTLDISLPAHRYSGTHSAAFWEEVLEEMQSLPGVKAAGMVHPLPLTDQWSLGFLPEGMPIPTTVKEMLEKVPVANSRTVGGDYISAMGITLKQGRYFTAADTAEAPPVIIINETMAQLHFPGESPIGKRLAVLNTLKPIYREIVGVVADVHHAGLDQEPGPEMYIHHLQAARGSFSLVVHTAVPPASLAAPVRNAIWNLDPGLPVGEIRAMGDVVADSLGLRRLYAALLVIFGAIAVLLALVGVYGVVSYSVARRVHEIGVRVALGARRGDILWMIIRRGLGYAVIGAAAGLLAALPLTRFLASQLFGVTPTDPFTFAMITAMLLTVTVTACYLPARKATRIDPMHALKYE